MTDFNYNEWPDVDLEGNVIPSKSGSTKSLKESIIRKRACSTRRSPLHEGKLIPQYIHYGKDGLVDYSADSMEELAAKIGVNPETVRYAIQRPDEYPCYAKTYIDEDDESDEADEAERDSLSAYDWSDDEEIDDDYDDEFSYLESCRRANKKKGCKGANHSLKEADGRRIKHPDLAKVKNSMTSIISQNMPAFKAVKTKEEVLNTLQGLLDDNGVDTPASRRLISAVSRSKTYFDALSAVMNSMLAGNNLRVNEAVEEDEDTVSLKDCLLTTIEAIEPDEDGNIDSKVVLDAIAGCLKDEDKEYLCGILCPEEAEDGLAELEEPED